MGYKSHLLITFYMTFHEISYPREESYSQKFLSYKFHNVFMKTFTLRFVGNLLRKKMFCHVSVEFLISICNVLVEYFGKVVILNFLPQNLLNISQSQNLIPQKLEKGLQSRILIPQNISSLKVI